MVLFYGLAVPTFAIAITEDAYTKLMFVHVVEEKSASNALPKPRSFMKLLKNIMVKYNTK